MKKSKRSKKVRLLRVAMVGGAAMNAQNVVTRFRKGWEVWGLNAIYPAWHSHIAWARRFNLHMWAHLVRDWKQGLRAEISMAQLQPKVPLYVLDPWRPGALPNEQIFPKDKLFAMPNGRYHSGSFDLMVAFAVLLGAKEISLHGVSLALDSPREEPISARACLEYWLGYATGRGVKVELVDCDLLFQYHLVRSTTVYGYDDVKLVEERLPATFDPRP